MTNDRQTPCGEREALIEYVYGELDAAGRARVDAHLETCAECRLEIEGLRGVRTQLATWTVPDVPLGFTIGPARAPSRPWWATGAVAAAAVLLLALASAIANLEITYGSDGVSVRTGWSRADASGAPASTLAAQPDPAAGAGPSSVPAAVPAATAATPVEGSPWRDDLAALERRLRTEFRSAAASAPARSQPGDDLLRQVQALIEQSELRQRRELALRVAQVVRDFDTQRQTDLVRIQQGLGQIEGSTAADRQLLNYLVRTAQRNRQ